MVKIDHILKLARIEIDEKEKKQIEKDFLAILKFVKEIEKVKAEGNVKPMSYPVEVYNVMREDKPTKSQDKEEKAKKLIKLAPDKKDNYIKVKQVL